MKKNYLVTRKGPDHLHGQRSRMAGYPMITSIVFWMLLFFCLPLAAQQAEVIRAYPAVYDLNRASDGQRQVLASGDVLLKEGRPVRITEPSAGAAGRHGVTLDLTARRSEEAPQRLALSITGEIVVRGEERRMELDDENGFISGAETQRITFENHSWLSLDDPSPVEITHEEGGISYVFTLMLQDAAFR